MRIILGFMFALLVSAAVGQSEMNPVKWSFDINQTGETEYELIFKANLDSGWVVYSKDTGEGGPIPVTVNYTSGNVKPNGDLKEIGDRVSGIDKMFGTEVVKYTSKAPYIVKQSVTIADISKPVTGYVTHMVCNNKVCLPPADAEFSFEIKVNPKVEVNPGEKKLKKKPF